MKLRDGREVVTDRPTPGGRYNIYDCAVGHPLLSMDADEGVTPMFTHCPDHPGVTSTSRGYMVSAMDVAVAMPVRMVWRRATSGELKRERRGHGTGGHYGSGGLAREWVP